MANTLIVRSTPLGALKCPRPGREGGDPDEHVVTFTSGITYTCSCGEVFQWEDQTHYVRAPREADA